MASAARELGNAFSLATSLNLHATLTELVGNAELRARVTALEERKIGCGPINTLDQVYGDPQVVARVPGRIERFPDPLDAPFRVSVPLNASVTLAGGGVVVGDVVVPLLHAAAGMLQGTPGRLGGVVQHPGGSMKHRPTQHWKEKQAASQHAAPFPYARAIASRTPRTCSHPESRTLARLGQFVVPGIQLRH